MGKKQNVKELNEVIADLEKRLAYRDMDSAVMQAERYQPPSNTVVITSTSGYYHAVISYDDLMDMVKNALTNDYANGGRAFIELEVVGQDATRVALDFATITTILDLRPKKETPDEA
jgi:hypothetical protein